MKIIRGQEIDEALKDNLRVYLCGDLKQENGLRHIPTGGYEIGISEYDGFTFEKAHYHSFNTEFNYVLEGAVKILLLSEGRELEFHKGDLFVIEVNEPYVGKSLGGTRTIFSKTPGGNDKVLVETDEAVLAWGESWEAAYREEALP